MRLIADDVPLDDGRFRRVFAAEAVSLLGTFIAPVALVFAVLEISDAAGVGLVLAAAQVPLVAAYDLFGSFALAPVGLALGGLLVEPIGGTTTLFATGIVLAALAALMWSIPGVRRLRAGL
jgi:hypothetical protein